MRAPFASLSVRAWSSPCVLGARQADDFFLLASHICGLTYLSPKLQL